MALTAAGEFAYGLGARTKGAGGFARRAKPTVIASHRRFDTAVLSVCEPQAQGTEGVCESCRIVQISNN
jgi:hypothetical protein